jgi:hypothetical protein
MIEIQQLLICLSHDMTVSHRIRITTGHKMWTQQRPFPLRTEGPFWQIVQRPLRRRFCRRCRRSATMRGGTAEEGGSGGGSARALHGCTPASTRMGECARSQSGDAGVRTLSRCDADALPRRARMLCSSSGGFDSSSALSHFQGISPSQSPTSLFNSAPATTEYKNLI